jgi:hypothetical protein
LRRVNTLSLTQHFQFDEANRELFNREPLPKTPEDTATALQSGGSLPENISYAVKSSYLLSFLEVFADGQLKLKEANA